MSKKVFLLLFVISLSISAVVGIILFLKGDFGVTEFKILLTTFITGTYSLSGLCSSILYEKGRFHVFSIIGMIISIIGFIYTTLDIWEIVPINQMGKGVIILLILTCSIAHSSLLLLTSTDRKIVSILLIISITCISLVCLEWIWLVLVGFDVDDFWWRLLGIFSILDVLGTIVTPVVNKLMNEKATIKDV